MLSILIPIYNYDIRKFVSELHKQAESEQTNFEIIAIDDASDMSFQNINKEINNLQNVHYIQLNKNIGRSKIRNLLAEKAKYAYLLFSDCDMEISDSNFIHNYIYNATDNTIICGGISYSEKPPQDSNVFFRWYYGINREKIPAENRNKNPYASFMSGNFFIPKIMFNKIKFHESVSEYGHEDTLFGIELKRESINILHINNPLIHCGLETTKIFIGKTEKAIKNLIFISKKYHYPELFENIKLLRISKKIHKLRFFICFLFKISKKLILKNFKSKNPKLFLFDFYKLGYYFQNLN